MINVMTMSTEDEEGQKQAEKVRFSPNTKTVICV